MTNSSHHTTEFDTQLDSMPIYRRYPILKPSIGIHYGKWGPKLLIIAESHYLPEKSTIHLDVEKWYEGDHRDLGFVGQENEAAWMNTRGILSKKNGFRDRGHAIYRNLEAALHDSGIPKSHNAFQYVAYMNGFQRPAVKGETINTSPIDVSNAVETIQRVIEVLLPDQIIIVSSKVRDRIGPQLDALYVAVPHPACRHWNRKDLKRGPGRLQFVQHVKAAVERHDNL